MFVGILFAFFGLLASVIARCGSRAASDGAWRILRRAAGHDQSEGVLGRHLHVDGDRRGAAFVFWFLIIQGPGSTMLRAREPAPAAARLLPPVRGAVAAGGPRRLRARRDGERSPELARIERPRPRARLARAAGPRGGQRGDVRAAAGINRYPDAVGGPARGLAEPPRRPAGAGRARPRRRRAAAGRRCASWRPAASSCSLAVVVAAARAGVPRRRPARAGGARGRRSPLAALAAAVAEAHARGRRLLPERPDGRARRPAPLRAFAGGAAARRHAAGRRGARRARPARRVVRAAGRSSRTCSCCGRSRRRGRWPGCAAATCSDPAGARSCCALGPGQGVAAPTQAGDRGGARGPRSAPRTRARPPPARGSRPSACGSRAAGRHAVPLRAVGRPRRLAGRRRLTRASIAHGLAAAARARRVRRGVGRREHVRVTLRDRSATERLAAALRALTPDAATRCIGRRAARV